VKRRIKEKSSLLRPYPVAWSFKVARSLKRVSFNMCGQGGQSTDAGGYGLGMLRAADGPRRAAPRGGLGLRSIEQARDLGLGVHGVALEVIAAS
jgi:hypothetical protein